MVLYALLVSLSASQSCSQTLALSPSGVATSNHYVHDDIHVQTLYNCLTGGNTTAVVAGKNWIAKLFNDSDCDICVYVGNPTNPSYVSPAVPDSYILGGLGSTIPRYYISNGSDVAPPGYDSTLSWGFDTTVFPSDKWIIDQAINVVNNSDPDFMYILLANMDEAGHLYGSFQDGVNPNFNNFINYQAMKDQLSITDSEVGRFIQFLSSNNKLSDSLIVVTADHGMSTMMNASKTVDLREILKNKGINMRAYDRTLLGHYNSSGDYDWLMSEGPVAYIYNVTPTKIADIKSDLMNYELSENEKPIWQVLNKTDQLSYNLYCPDYGSVIWPDLIVLMQQNYMCPVYYDEFTMGVNAFMAEINVPPIGIGDVPTIPGAHGTYSEQRVPLIVNGSGVTVGTNNTRVSTLDIVPTICHMNSWDKPTGAAGNVLLDVGTPPSTRARRTYIIALDGMRSDYYNYGSPSLTPNLAKLASHGRVYTNCTDVLVALTGTNHVAIITAAPAGTSGILGVGAYYTGLDMSESEVGVGGIVLPVDKITLLAPYIGLASTIIVGTAVTAVCVKRVRRRKEKQ